MGLHCVIFTLLKVHVMTIQRLLTCGQAFTQTWYRRIHHILLMTEHNPAPLMHLPAHVTPAPLLAITGKIPNPISWD
jgi:hypothetical protein